MDVEQFTIYFGVLIGPSRESSRESSSGRGGVGGEGGMGKLNVVVWCPKWEGFGGLDTDKKYKHQVWACMYIHMYIYIVIDGNFDSREERIDQGS